MPIAVRAPVSGYADLSDAARVVAGASSHWGRSTLALRVVGFSLGRFVEMEWKAGERPWEEGWNCRWTGSDWIGMEALDR